MPEAIPEPQPLAQPLIPESEPEPIIRDIQNDAEPSSLVEEAKEESKTQIEEEKKQDPFPMVPPSVPFSSSSVIKNQPPEKPVLIASRPQNSPLSMYGKPMQVQKFMEKYKYSAENFERSRILFMNRECTDVVD